MKTENVMEQSSDAGFDFRALVFIHLLVLGVKGATREEISSFLSTIGQKWLPIEPFFLRKVPGGYQSESLDDVLGGWLSQSFCSMADSQGSVSLTLPGIKELSGLLVDEFLRNPERFKMIAQNVGFDLRWAMLLLSTQFPKRS